MHVRLSWRHLALICLLLLARPSGASAGMPERLRWVRGTVVSVGSTSVSTQLRNTTLTLALDEASSSRRSGTSAAGVVVAITPGTGGVRRA